MKVFEEMNFNDILSTSWGGAGATAECIEEKGKGDEFVSLIEELYPEGIDRTTLNDILWFDYEWVFESLGIKLGIKDDEDEEESGDDE
jgi:hypothetical protein